MLKPKRSQSQAMCVFRDLAMKIRTGRPGRKPTRMNGDRDLGTRQSFFGDTNS